eukprot:UN32366
MRYLEQYLPDHVGSMASDGYMMAVDIKNNKMPDLDESNFLYQSKTWRNKPFSNNDVENTGTKKYENVFIHIHRTNTRKVKMIINLMNRMPNIESLKLTEGHTTDMGGLPCLGYRENGLYDSGLLFLSKHKWKVFDWNNDKNLKDNKKRESTKEFSK